MNKSSRLGREKRWMDRRCCIREASFSSDSNWFTHGWNIEPILDRIRKQQTILRHCLICLPMHGKTWIPELHLIQTRSMCFRVRWLSCNCNSLHFSPSASAKQSCSGFNTLSVEFSYCAVTALLICPRRSMDWWRCFSERSPAKNLIDQWSLEHSNEATFRHSMKYRHLIIVT